MIVDRLLFGVPEGNRTPDLRFRKPSLYPTELRARMSALYQSLDEKATESKCMKINAMRLHKLY